MTAAAQTLVTEAEFLALPESTAHIELIDGEVFMAPSPTLRHQEVLRRLVIALSRWAEEAGRGRDVSVAQAPLDVRFGPNRILQPDAMVFLARLPDDSATPIERIPELCVEVVSANRAYDRVTKRLVYAEAGVQEYWLVDGVADSIEVRTGPLLSDVQLAVGRLSSPRLPGLAVDLLTLFARRS
jgi:Uma2 family endonuclease